MKKLAALFIFLSLFIAPQVSHAQTICNSSSGFIKLKGPFTAGDTMALASDCQSAIDSGQIGNQIDVFCGSGRPCCDVFSQGAVGDGVTDDSGAFNRCVNQCAVTRNFGACPINVPASQSVYCIKSTWNLTNFGNTSRGGFVITGPGVQGGILSACGANVNVVKLDAQWIDLGHLSIFGYGAQQTDPVFSGTAPSQPTVLMTNQCSNCDVHDDYIIGGTAAFQNNGACGYTLNNVWLSFSYGDGNHVAGFFNQINCGGTVFNSHFDMVYPVSQPAHPSVINAYAATTGYAPGTIVSVTCNTSTFYVQAANNGFSGSSFPGCKPFGAFSADNVTGTCPSPSAGVCWTLVNRATSYCAALDTGSIETEFLMTDLTCAADTNIGYTNTFAGQAPQQNSLIRSTPGGAISQNVFIGQGTQHTTILGVETSYCMLTGCNGMLINTTGNANKSVAMDCINGFTNCVKLVAGPNTTITEMTSTGADAAGADLAVTGAVQGFHFENSTHVSGSAQLFNIAAVAADHYIIANNICNGATSTDGGTGTHKSVTACAGAGP